MSIRITSPIEGHTDKSTFGPLTVQFKDGVAEVDELSQPLRAWLETKGYKVETLSAGPFDPGKHTVDEVWRYLQTAESVEEVNRVMAAERDGKARKSLVEGFDKIEAERAANADPIVTVPGDGQGAGEGGQGGDAQ